MLNFFRRLRRAREARPMTRQQLRHGMRRLTYHSVNETGLLSHLTRRERRKIARDYIRLSR